MIISIEERIEEWSGEIMKDSLYHKWQYQPFK